jgi:hypothetical protein
MPEAKKPFVEITPYDAKQFFETPDSVVEAKRDALYGEGALGRFAVNAIAKRGGLVGVVFAPDKQGVKHPARVVNLGADFGTPVHVDVRKPFEDQYEPLDIAVQEEERAENMATDTVSIKREAIDALDAPVEETEDPGEPTQTVDMKGILDEGREAEIVPVAELEEAIPEAEAHHETLVEEPALEDDQPANVVEAEVVAKKPQRQLSVAERLAGLSEPAEAEDDSEFEGKSEISSEQQNEFEKLVLQDMEVAEAVSRVLDHVTEQLDTMSKATVEVAARFDEAYPKAFRIGHTIEQSGVLPVLEDMKKTFGEHDARITDMQGETARYVEAEENSPKEEQSDERVEKQAQRKTALETIEKISEQLADMEEANSGVLEVQRKLDSSLLDHAQLIYYPDVPVFRGATETANEAVSQLTDRLTARSESAKRVRSLLEDLTNIQDKLQAEE